MFSLSKEAAVGAKGSTSVAVLAAARTTGTWSPAECPLLDRSSSISRISLGSLLKHMGPDLQETAGLAASLVLGGDRRGSSAGC